MGSSTILGASAQTHSDSSMSVTRRITGSKSSSLMDPLLASSASKDLDLDSSNTLTMSLLATLIESLVSGSLGLGLVRGLGRGLVWGLID